MDVLKLIGRNEELFGSDIRRYEAELSSLVVSARFLVTGGAGSIGQAGRRHKGRILNIKY